MRELQVFLETPAARRLAWSLVAFLWQGTLVAAILACLDMTLRRRDPRARYAAACAALLLMLVLPAVTFARYGREAGSPVREGVAAAATNAGDATRVLAPAQVPAGQGAGRDLSLSSLRKSAAGLAPLLVPVWFVGAFLLSLRFLAGWNCARRLSHNGAEPELSALEALALLRRKMRISRPVLLLESAAVNVPAALGALRPMILLPVCAVTGLSREALEAALAHELAHIRRHDYLVNLLQTAAETLLFYHPAVWWVSRLIREERENCCDDLAVAAIGDSRGYARALLALEESRSLPWASSSPAVAADGGSLRKRITRLLPGSSRRGEEAPLWLAGLLALATLATMGAAYLFEAPQSEPSGSVPAASPVRTAAAGSSGGRKAPLFPKPANEAAVAGGVPGSIREAIAGGIQRGIRGAIAGGISGAISGGVEGGMKEDKPAAEKKAKLSAEELADLKRHGVTPEFLSGLAALGYKTATVEELLSARTHGVDPEYISEMTALLGKLSLDQLVSLRIHGVTPEFARGFRGAGYSELSADALVSLRIHGVDPAEATDWEKLLGRKPALDELVSARIHGATPEFARELRSLGFEAGLDTLVSLRIHGVTPADLRAMQSLGYAKISVDEALACRIHGVTPDFVKEVQSLGYAGPSLDELVSLRIHGVTPDFIRKANGSAGTRLSLEALVDRRIHGRKK